MSTERVPNIRQRRVASYREAIDWIAWNDDTEWLPAMDAGDKYYIPSVTLCLVAEIFGRTIEDATDDLRRALKRRERHSA